MRISCLIILEAIEKFTKINTFKARKNDLILNIFDLIKL